MTDLPTRSRLNSHLDRPQEVKAGTGTAILDPHEQPLPEPAPAPMMSFWIRDV
jgi:hypothetical protein